MSSHDMIKTIGYILVLILVFSPLTFMVANAFTNHVEDNCYEKYPYMQKINASEDEQTQRDNQRLQCQEEYKIALGEQQTIIFIVVSLLSIITLAVLLISNNIAPVISYGLFFGVSINIIRLVWGFNEANSFVAMGLGIILFVVALIFINKSISKKESFASKIKKKLK